MVSASLLVTVLATLAASLPVNSSGPDVTPIDFSIPKVQPDAIDLNKRDPNALVAFRVKENNSDSTIVVPRDSFDYLTSRENIDERSPNALVSFYIPKDDLDKIDVDAADIQGHVARL